MNSSTTEHQTYQAGDVTLQSGRVFRGMQIAYKTFGSLNADRSNVIVYPTSYSAQHPDLEFMIGNGAALDPSRWFIVIPNLFGNGLSSSRSNTPAAAYDDGAGLPYPNITYFDAVQLQRRMLLELWGIDRVALVYGWSMGAMQAYHWAALFPRCSGTHRGGLRLGALRAAQQGLHRGRQACADGRPGVSKRRVHRVARARLPRHGAGPTRAGPCRRPSTGRSSGAPSAPTRLSRTSRLTGTGTSRAAIRTICWPSSGPGKTATSAPTRSTAAICPPHWQRSAPVCC